MRLLHRALDAIPRLLASTVAITFLVLLFFYLVVLGAIGLFIPDLEPSVAAQLVLGNYTNVTSAIGASLAASIGTVSLREVRKHRAHASIFHAQVRDHLGLPHPEDEAAS